jgi:hypothetical protein
MAEANVIELVCKKRKTLKERDTVTILCGERTWVFKAWHQGILPHELVHYGVEAAYGMRGFVRLIADGLTSEDILAGGADTEALHTEFLTSAHQYELAGQSEPTNTAFRELLESFRGETAPVAVSDEQIERGREVLADLTLRWGAVGLGESLRLSLAKQR